MIKSLNSFLQIQKFKKPRRNKSTLEKKMSNQNQKENFQIPTTNSNANMMVVKKVLLDILALDFMSKVLMKELHMIVIIVTKALMLNQIWRLMWKLFIWIWRISNVMNVINLLDEKKFLTSTLQLSIEMRRNSNVTIVRNLLE